MSSSQLRQNRPITLYLAALPALPALSSCAVMYKIQMPSGVVEAIAEGAILLVTVILSAGTLQRIRGLCLEHNLRRGKVVSLHGRTLTLPETIASLLFVAVLPIATLLTSVGRNGESAPMYKTAIPAVVDVWHTDISTPAFYRDATGARAPFSLTDPVVPLTQDFDSNSFHVCGTGATGFTPQAATNAGKTHCPGSFNVSKKYATPGFVSSEYVEEKPPESLFRAQNLVMRSGDWRSQCNVTGIYDPKSFDNRCYVWKWTRKEVSICGYYSLKQFGEYNGSRGVLGDIAACHTFKLGPGAPLVDSDKAGRKIRQGNRHRAGSEGRHGTHLKDFSLLAAHFLVSTTKDLLVDVRSGEMQITVIESSSAVVLFSVLIVSISAWILAWLAAHMAARRGYNMRLHTYSGLAAYAASLEDKYNNAAGTNCVQNSSGSSVDGGELAVQGAEMESKMHSYISLKPGDGHFVGGFCISHSPDLPKAAGRKGRFGTSVPSFGDAEQTPHSWPDFSNWDKGLT